MMRKKVLVSHNLYREGFSKLEKEFDVVYPQNEFFTTDEVIAHHGDVYAIVPTYSFKVRQGLIDSLPQLKIIANYGTGYDNIDFEYAGEHGIVVTNSPDPVTEPTAELAYTMMLTLARRLSENDRKIRVGELKWGVMHNIGATLHRKTLGIVGLGNIGQVVARHAQGAQMQILYSNRTRLDPQTELQLNAHHVGFDTLVQQSDFISIHTPLTDQTRHMFSQREFAMMKPTAFIVNTARGPIIDEQALVEALIRRKIAGAGLDVFEFEPNIAPELLSMDNVVLAPHTGTSTVDTRNDMAAFASQNIIRFSQGCSDITQVNKLKQ